MVLEDHLIYHCFKKYVQFYRNRLIGVENELKVARWEGWGEGLVREFGIDRYTLLYLKWITNKDLLHMELCGMLCGSLDGRGVWGRWIHVYVWLSPFTVRLKLTQRC